MKWSNLFSVLASGLVFLMLACNGSQGQQLDAKAFQEKMRASKNALVLDVRTAQEVSGGFIEGAVNIDWTKDGFEIATEQYDRSMPVFVYCLSGGRSASAAGNLRSRGFKEVYELNGGMMSWRSANYPEVKPGQTKAKAKGMDRSAYDVLINSDTAVLIDFYAPWCLPCKKMEPFLNEMAADSKTAFKIVRINADENPDLCKELEVDALPVLVYYKAGREVWREKRFMSKEDILQMVK